MSSVQLVKLAFKEENPSGAPESKHLSITFEFADEIDERQLFEVWKKTVENIENFTQIRLPLRPDRISYPPEEGARRPKRKAFILSFSKSSVSEGWRKEILGNFGADPQAVGMLINQINQDLGAGHGMG